VRNTTQTALAPIQSFATWLFSPVGEFFSDIFSIRQTRERIQELESENEKLKAQVVVNEDIKGELKQLKSVLDLAGKARYEVVSARVISRGGTGTFSESIVIDAGSAAGIKPEMTVIAGEGLVGVVKSTTANNAVVMLMSDPAFRIGVRVAGSQDMGILSGQGDDNFSVMMLRAESELRVGDVLLSRGSSGDKPFVPGVPVGRVSLVESALGQLTKEARVSAYVNLDSLRIVSVVLDSVAGDPGDSLVPRAPRPTPTVTIFVTPTPNE
jgi:rod shape-determining protein MreC